MKPKIIKDLLAGGHITIGDVKSIARTMFDGEQVTDAGEGGLEGYVIEACTFDELPIHVQGFIIKAILEFKVQNFLDVKEEAAAPARKGGVVVADSKPRHFAVGKDGTPIRKRPRRENVKSVLPIKPRD